MSETLPEFVAPRDEFLAQGADLTPDEERMALSIADAGERADNLDAVGAAIAGSYLLYRLYMARRLREEALTRNIKPGSLWQLNGHLFASYKLRFIATLLPALVSGYAIGMREARVTSPSVAWLNQTATKYADTLGDHINDVSGSALVEGYQAQLNRRIAQRVALDRTINAFGVTPRTMSTVVNIYGNPPVPSTTVKPVSNPVHDRADKVIAKAIQQRAMDIGSTESYAAKNQAKALVWMYTYQQGAMPRDATKMWVTARDERVCPICGPMHKVRVPIMEPFTLSGGNTVWSPGVHPRCRCDIVLRFASELITTVDLTVMDQEPVLEVAKSAWGVIHKARGSDNYDRDKRGRFATVEQRPVRTADPAVQRIMAQVQAMSQEAGVASVDEVFARHGIKQPIRATEIRAGGGIKATGAIQARGEIKASEGIKTGASITAAGPKASKVEASKITASTVRARQLTTSKIELPSMDKIKATKPDDSGLAENEIWMRTTNQRAMFGIFPPGSGERFSEIVEGRDHNEILHADDGVIWYPRYNRALGDPGDLMSGLAEYWNERVFDDDVITVNFENEDRYDPELDLVVIENQDGIYYVDKAAYVDAWDSAVTGMDTKHAHLVEVEFLPKGVSIFDDDGEKTDIPASFIADTLRITNRVYELTPTIGVSDFVNVQQAYFDHTGKGQNPGKYTITGLVEENLQAWHGRSDFYPYRMVHVDPSELYPGD